MSFRVVPIIAALVAGCLVSAPTGAWAAVPGAPRHLVVDSATGSAVAYVAWEAPEDSGDGAFEYELERMDMTFCSPFDPGCQGPPAPTVRTFPSTTTSVTDTDVTVGHDYSYCIRTRNSDGVSPGGDCAHLRIGRDNTPPSAVDLIVSVRSGEYAQFKPRGMDAENVEGRLDEWAAPAHGEVKHLAESYLQYTPEPGFEGTDSFDFRIEDNEGASGTGTVSITVTEGGTGASFVRTTGHADRAVGIGTPSPERPVTVTLVPPSTGEVTITDDPGIADPPGFLILGRQYRIDHPAGTATKPTGIRFDLTEGLIPSRNPVTVTAFRDGTAVASCSDAPSNTLVGPADPDPCVVQKGSSSIWVRSAASTGEWTLGVNSQGNHAPVAAELEYSLRSGTSQDISLRSVDADGDAVQLVVDTDPVHGSLEKQLGQERVIYTPDTGYVGEDSFVFTASDQFGATDSATVHLTVTDPVKGEIGVTRPAEANETVHLQDGDREAEVFTPNAGQVTVATDPSLPDPSGYQVVGTQYQIEAPDASADQPLQLQFKTPRSNLPDGVEPENVEVFRDGVAIADCADTSGKADPDPCVSLRSDGDPFYIRILSSHASGWTLGVAPTDITPPTVTCSASPSSLKSNDHKLVAIRATVTVTDESGGSGVDGFALVSVVSNQADSGLGDDDLAGDHRDWSIGTSDTSGQLRRERYGSNRVYTLTYEGSDAAGNDATCRTTVTVSKGK